MQYGETPYLLSHLDNVKRFMKKSTAETEDDALLNAFLLQATSRIEQFLNRNIRYRSYSSELIDGSGTNTLFLKNPPIDTGATLAIYEDSNREFGAATEVSSDDYAVHAGSGYVKKDGGLLWTTGNLNHKATYSGGFQNFVIISGVNDTIEWNNGDADFYVNITAGTYTGADLVTAIQTAMDLEDDSLTVTVSYNELIGKFRFVAASGTFILKLFNGTYSYRTMGYTLGYDPAVDQSTLNAFNWGSWNHETGTVTAIASGSAAIISLDQRCGIIEVENTTKAENNLHVSFDGGDTFTTIYALTGRYSFPFRCTSIKIYADISGATYEVSYTYESGSLTWVSDVPVFGIPKLIELACHQLVQMYWEYSGRSAHRRLGYKSISTDMGATISFDEEIEDRILGSINSFKRILI